MEQQDTVHSYRLTIYYPQKNTNQNSEQQKIFNARVLIDEAGTGELPNNIL